MWFQNKSKWTLMFAHLFQSDLPVLAQLNSMLWFRTFKGWTAKVEKPWPASTQSSRRGEDRWRRWKPRLGYTFQTDLQSWCSEGRRGPHSSEGSEPGRNSEASGSAWLSPPTSDTFQSRNWEQPRCLECRRKESWYFWGRREELKCLQRGCGFHPLHTPSVTPYSCPGHTCLSSNVLCCTLPGPSHHVLKALSPSQPPQSWQCLLHLSLWKHWLPLLYTPTPYFVPVSFISFHSCYLFNLSLYSWPWVQSRSHIKSDIITDQDKKSLMIGKGKKSPSSGWAALVYTLQMPGVKEGVPMWGLQTEASQVEIAKSLEGGSPDKDPKKLGHLWGQCVEGPAPLWDVTDEPHGTTWLC